MTSAATHVPSNDPASLRACLGIADSRVFVWARTIPYFYCAFSRWAQHSAYLRQLEETTDRFLAHIGLPIGEVLRRRGWIPVVQEHAVEVLEPVELDEELLSGFAVTNVIAGRLFRARFDCWVLREGTSRHVASGHITHGWLALREPEWESRLTRLDRATVALLERWVTEDRLPGAPRSREEMRERGARR